MNECSLYKNKLALDAEHELDESDKLAIANHIKSCQSCAAKISDVQIIRNQLRNITKIKTTSDFETVLRARIQMSKNIGQDPLTILYKKYRLPALGFAIATIVATIAILHPLNMPSILQQSGVPTDLTFKNIEPLDIQAGGMVYTMDIIRLPEIELEARKSHSTNENRGEPAETKENPLIITSYHSALKADALDKHQPRRQVNESHHPVSF